MSGKEHETIVIVRKKGGHGGHHGGAWKVAYADFVTAMMAFFLVMWLVTQSKEVKSAVGGYFRDPGVFEFEKGKGVLPGGQPGVEPGAAPEVTSPKTAADDERARLEATADLIRKEMTQLKGFDNLRDQVQFTITPEGLRIDLIDKAASSFFDSGSAALRGESEQILGLIAHELGALTNDVVVEGHTDSRQYADGDRYGNWELSAERANAARRVMERTGLREGQVRAVRGFADRQLQLPQVPLDPRNRRVSIVVRSQAAKGLEDALHGDTAAPATAPRGNPADEPPTRERTRPGKRRAKAES
ncbi:MAG: flagellar motor protein MotB [Vicinamibacterales bacterium]